MVVGTQEREKLGKQQESDEGGLRPLPRTRSRGALLSTGGKLNPTLALSASCYCRAPLGDRASTPRVRQRAAEGASGPGAGGQAGAGRGPGPACGWWLLLRRRRPGFVCRILLCLTGASLET